LFLRPCCAQYYRKRDLLLLSLSVIWAVLRDIEITESMFHPDKVFVDS
jgi:hypothetical protein